MKWTQKIDRDQRREKCLKQDIPIISKDTEQFLREYIAEHKPHSIIEIGSAVGYSTSLLGQSVANYDSEGDIYSREVSYPHYRQSIGSVHNNTRVFFGNFCHYDCTYILKKGYFDMVFIDGRKSETLLYLKNLLPYIHNNTHIIIDDAIKFKEKMQDCYDLLDKKGIIYQEKMIDQDDGVIIIPKSELLITALSSL